MEEKEEEEEGGDQGKKSGWVSLLPSPSPLSFHRPNPLFPRKKVEEKGGWGKRRLLPLFIIQEEEEVNPGRLILSLLHPPTPFPNVRKNILQKKEKSERNEEKLCIINGPLQLFEIRRQHSSLSQDISL